jgi:ribonuclease P/MRP protein subunit RPP1
VGCTISSEPSNYVPPNPFLVNKPFPNLDPRSSASTSTSGSGSGSGLGSSSGKGSMGKIVQVTRFHIRLDDHKTHCFVCLLYLALILPVLLRPLVHEMILIR